MCLHAEVENLLGLAALIFLGGRVVALSDALVTVAAVIDNDQRHVGALRHRTVKLARAVSARIACASDRFSRNAIMHHVAVSYVEGMTERGATRRLTPPGTSTPAATGDRCTG